MRRIREVKETGGAVVDYEIRCLRCGAVYRARYEVDATAYHSATWAKEVVALDRHVMAASGYAVHDAPHDGFCRACLAQLASIVGRLDDTGILEWFRLVNA